MADIKSLIISHQNLNKDLFKIIDVGKDGNCFYRTLSLYFTNEETYFNFFRNQIYLAAKNNIESLKEFFVEDEEDQILVNNKIEGYIEKIKENMFFAGNVEINLAAKIFAINIAIYEIINNNKYYTPYAIFTPESNPEDIILINLERRNHYNLLKLKDNKYKISFYETNSKAIESNTFKIFKENTLSKNNTYFKDDIYKNSGKFINVRDKPNYYEDLYKFLSSIEKAKYINNFNETKIQWKFVKYPNTLFEIDMKQSTKDKKKFNYRNKAKNYKLENNNIYFTGYAGSNKCKLRIPYLNEKNNILTIAHSNNGHLGINRTSAKVKELGYFWESLTIDIKEFIDNCPQCIMAKKSNIIKQKNKVIITKGPLERIVADGWMLDNDLKSITGFSWVIDLIDHFSKFLMSIPVKNNNADNR